jgi:hypothetical protein
MRRTLLALTWVAGVGFFIWACTGKPPVFDSSGAAGGNNGGPQSSTAGITSSSSSSTGGTTASNGTSGCVGSSSTGSVCTSPAQASGTPVQALVTWTFEGALNCADAASLKGVVAMKVVASNGITQTGGCQDISGQQQTLFGPITPGHWGVDVQALDSTGTVVFEGVQPLEVVADGGIPQAIVPLTAGPFTGCPVCGLR